jgi:hypothetical protein
VGDPRLDEPRRCGVFWMHHEAEELRVHHRTTIPPEETRALVVTLLASGRVPPLQATLAIVATFTSIPTSCLEPSVCPPAAGRGVQWNPHARQGLAAP